MFQQAQDECYRDEAMQAWPQGLQLLWGLGGDESEKENERERARERARWKLLEKQTEHI